jgi:hypothetical protein
MQCQASWTLYRVECLHFGFLSVVLKSRSEDASRKLVPPLSPNRSRTADGNTTAARSFLHASLTLQRLTLLS